MTTQLDATSVSTDVHVDAPIEHAFRVFTEQIGTWWNPQHHIIEGQLAEMIFEPRVGGSIIDRAVDGSECRWARVLAFDPPQRVCFSWDITTSWQIERDPAKTSEVDVTFTAEGPDRTHVILTHRHLDRHGAGWQTMRDAVGSGWSLTRYAEVATSLSTRKEGRTDMDQTLPTDNSHVRGVPLPLVSDEFMRERLAASRSYTAVLLRATDRLIRPDVDPIIWEHGRRNFALREQGVLPVVLPCTDDSDWAGLAVFAAAPEDVRAIMDTDPGVAAGIFNYELHPVRGFPGSALPTD
jgi:uncharacterized protein YndB with AHSA1/START domain